ncbi:MAG: cytochrome c peroxidase [Gammaproteobacteria bacterium]|jgi:cytochrome c peroxidase
MVKTTICLLLIVTAVCLVVGAPWVLATDSAVAGIATNRTTTEPHSAHPMEPIRPIPLQLNVDAREAELGQQLFTDRRLEKNGKIACADCHNIRKGGANAKRMTQSLNNPESQHNTPTIFNVIYNKHYYWTARFTSLHHQLDDAIKELGVSWEQLIDKLRRTPKYIRLFDQAFPVSGITVFNVKQAIIAYERSLTTPNSRFDKYLRGDVQALNNIEKKGYELFKSYGCSACHQGINVGGNLAIDPAELYGKKQFFPSGNIPAAYNRLSFSLRGNTKIRVPSLRNVAVTAPYFHDGSADTLEQAVVEMANTMAYAQLGIRIPSKDIEQIVAFLRTLTGEYNGKAL